MSPVTRDRVLLSYSPADAPWVERLRKRLEDLEALGLLEAREMQATWAGPRWREERQEVAEALTRAKVAVLLVSPDYLASELVAGDELYRLLAYQRELKVVWLPVRPCDFGASSLCSYPALLQALRPSLAEMDEEGAERELKGVAEKILRLLEGPRDRPNQESPASERSLRSMGLNLHAFEMLGSLASPKLGGSETPGSRPRQPVHLGASAPRVVEPGHEFTARFAAYHPELAREARRQLEKAGAKSRAHLDLASALWQVGTTFTVRLAGDGLEVSPASQSFVWEGQEHYLDFDVRARKGSSYVTRLKFDVCIDGFVLARLRLDLAVRESRLRLFNYVLAEAPRTAFASYATEDRPRVLDRVAAIRIAAGLDVFMDCLSLNPSERWRTRLEEEIPARDLFMLFWSRAAAKSHWVEWEWRCALERKGLDAIQAHPLDPWPKAPLPQELSALHSGDPLMAVRETALKGA